MKIFGKSLAVLVSVFCLTARAEPVMTLITVNTADPAGYAAWARSNAEDISKANGAVAMGLCSPTTGAEQMGDHYLWSFFPSLSLHLSLFLSFSVSISVSLSLAVAFFQQRLQ